MNELKATCGFCGRVFEPHPDSFWETGFTAMLEKDGETLDVPAFSVEELEMASDYSLQEAGLDRETAEILLKMQVGESVDTGAVAVCDECAKKDDPSK